MLGDGSPEEFGEEGPDLAEVEEEDDVGRGSLPGGRTDDCLDRESLLHACTYIALARLRSLQSSATVSV